MSLGARDKIQGDVSLLMQLSARTKDCSFTEES